MSKPVRDSWMEIWCSDEEVTRWLRAAGIPDVEKWRQCPEGPGVDKKFQDWCRKALDKAAETQG